GLVCWSSRGLALARAVMPGRRFALSEHAVTFGSRDAPRSADLDGPDSPGRDHALHGPARDAQSVREFLHGVGRAAIDGWLLGAHHASHFRAAHESQANRGARTNVRTKFEVSVAENFR